MDSSTRDSLIHKLHIASGRMQLSDRIVFNNLLCTIANKLTKEFRMNFSALKVKRKVKKERDLYNTFLDYIAMPSVNYNRIRNMIDISPFYWNCIGHVSYSFVNVLFFYIQNMCCMQKVL